MCVRVRQELSGRVERERESCAALAQDHGVYELMEAWLRRAASGIEWGSSQGGGTITKGALRITGINLQSVLSVQSVPMPGEEGRKRKT